MPGPSREPPSVGAPARIVHFGGGSELAVVIALHEQGRRLLVRDRAGEEHEFVLSPATARFVAVGDPHGARLELLAQAPLQE